MPLQYVRVPAPDQIYRLCETEMEAHEEGEFEPAGGQNNEQDE